MEEYRQLEGATFVRTGSYEISDVVVAAFGKFLSPGNQLWKHILLRGTELLRGGS